jgi:4-diphosphocytidyl-2-C-methyl-D-erythritol kinase
MIFFPNAKINIGLFITSRRRDGYHNLESVFHPIGLSDILEIKERTYREPIFTTTGIPLDTEYENNLCYKAYKLVSRHFNIPPVSFHLHKIIPPGSGLGGGSSDAAFTLKALKSLFKLDAGRDELMEMAMQLGSDCPFFIENSPAYVWEKGNQMENFDPQLKGQYLAVVVPQVHISTRHAYQGINPRQRPFPLKELIEKTPFDQWADYITNDFETPVFKAKPQLEGIKHSLYEEGAWFASLSGSGSAVYGLFSHPSNLKDGFGNSFVWEGKL